MGKNCFDSSSGKKDSKAVTYKRAFHLIISRNVMRMSGLTTAKVKTPRWPVLPTINSLRETRTPSWCHFMICAITATIPKNSTQYRPNRAAKESRSFFVLLETLLPESRSSYLTTDAIDAGSIRTIRIAQAGVTMERVKFSTCLASWKTFHKRGACQ